METIDSDSVEPKQSEENGVATSNLPAPGSPQSQLPDGEMEQAFSEQRFWAKLGGYAASAGKDVVEAALKLFYALQDPDTPKSAKAIIVAALAYFIIPIDAVADLLPGGYVDDWGVLLSACWTVAKHVKDEHSARAKAKLQQWFPDASE